MGTSLTFFYNFLQQMLSRSISWYFTFLYQTTIYEVLPYFNKTNVFGNTTDKQECLPVGCVPPARYRMGGLCPGGLYPGGSLSRGVSVWGFLSRGSLSRGISVRGGVPLSRGVSVQGVSLTEMPVPPWTESQTRVETLPCRNFVAGGKNAEVWE